MNNLPLPEIPELDSVVTLFYWMLLSSVRDEEQKKRSKLQKHESG